MSKSELDNWLTASQIMKLIGWKSRSTVLSTGRKYEWRKQRVGAAWVYWRADIERYIEQRRSGGVPALVRPE